MERQLLTSSSLARKFFEDFPDAAVMPLQLTERQQAAYQHVLPLLSLDPASCTLPQCMQAVAQLIQLFSSTGGAEQYSNVRSLADYLQSIPALCLIDAAGALSLSSSSMPAFLASLRSRSPELYAALLHEELRRRLVANHLPSMASPVHTRLSHYPPVAGAILCADAADFMIVREPPWESTAHLFAGRAAAAAVAAAPGGGAAGSVAGSTPTGVATPTSPNWVPYAALQQQVCGARRLQQLPPPGTLLRPAIWRRQLQAGSSRYLLPLLGRDEGGSVVLSGPCIPAAIAGAPPATAPASPPPAATPPSAPAAISDTPAAHEAAETGTSSSCASQAQQQQQQQQRGVCMLSFVGYSSAAAAGQALTNCLVEVLTRYRARHPSPVTDAAGQPVQPLVVNTRHHVLLLLPEAVQSGQPGAAGQHHDAALCFDLTLHKDVEALLLAAPDPLAAWAYDGDVVWSTPRGLRALCGRALLVDPLTLTTAVAEGGLQLQAQVIGEEGRLVGSAAAGAAAAAAAGGGPVGGEAAAAAGGGGGGGGGPSTSGRDTGTAVGGVNMTELDASAAMTRLQQLAGSGWQPLLLAPNPPGSPAGSGAEAGRVRGYASVVDMLRSQEAGGGEEQGCVAGAAFKAAGAGAGLQGCLAQLHSVSQLLQQPQLLRALLEPGGDSSSAMSSEEQLLQRRLVQVLRLEQGWVWHHPQLGPSGAASVEASAIAAAAQAGWWSGPLLRGCVLREDAAVQAASPAAGG